MLLTSRKADHVARPDFLDRATPPLHPPETIRTGEPSVMSFIKRAKILATRVYEFFEGGDIDTIANSPDNLIRRTNRTTFSDLRKSGIHQAFGEFVVHTPSVAITSSCCSGARRVAKPDLGKPSKTIKPSDRRLPQR